MELVDFCNNQSKNGEFYNMKNISSNQYYAYLIVIQKVNPHLIMNNQYK